jgi:hypothetical protein
MAETRRNRNGEPVYEVRPDADVTAEQIRSMGFTPDYSGYAEASRDVGVSDLSPDPDENPAMRRRVRNSLIGDYGMSGENLEGKTTTELSAMLMDQTEKRPERARAAANRRNMQAAMKLGRDDVPIPEMALPRVDREARAQRIASQMRELASMKARAATMPGGEDVEQYVGRLPQAQVKPLLDSLTKEGRFGSQFADAAREGVVDVDRYLDRIIDPQVEGLRSQRSEQVRQEQLAMRQQAMEAQQEPRDFSETEEGVRAALATKRRIAEIQARAEENRGSLTEREEMLYDARLERLWRTIDSVQNTIEEKKRQLDDLEGSFDPNAEERQAQLRREIQDQYAKLEDANAGLQEVESSIAGERRDQAEGRVEGAGGLDVGQREQYNENNPARPTSREEYEALPAGAYYLRDGVLKQKRKAD